MKNLEKLKEEIYAEVTRRILESYETGDLKKPYCRQEVLNSFLPKPTIEDKKHGQDWAKYDLAKTNEDILFKRILLELLIIYDDEIVNNKGRKPYSVKDRVFSMCVKSYYRSDLRKCASILKELRNLHYIERTPCYKSIDNFFNDERLSKVLDDLILITAMPIAQLENTAAIDATGFSISRFSRWSDFKYGRKEGKERIWRKAHAVALCKTNIFLSVEVTEKNVNDAPMFEKVVGKKTIYFDLENFVADKAYSSRKIHNFIRNLGLIPYIPFRKNVTGVSRGSSIWSQMFAQFKYENDKFMEKYHQRSNIETSFHMVKQRFGDNLKTRSFIANANEIKTRFLCHNICVLIQESFENNIKIDFGSCVKKI